MAVATGLLVTSGARGATAYSDTLTGTAAANVIDAMRRGRDYVFTDDHHTADVEARLRAILASRADVLD